jgi:hypothetical protein
MSSPDAPTVDRSSFLPAFGATSLTLALFSIAFSWLSGIVIRSLRESLPQSSTDAESVSNTIRIVATLSMGIMWILVTLAIVFGFLSLLGKGKRNGSSRRLSGTCGLLIGAFLAWTLSMLPATTRALQANTQVPSGQPTNQTMRSAEHGIELNWPGEPWQVFEPATISAQPGVILTAVRKGADPALAIVGMVIVEKGDIEAFDEFSPNEIAEALISSARVADPVLELVEAGSFQGRSAVIFQYTGANQEGQEMRVKQMVFLEKGKMTRLLCGGGIVLTDAEGDVFRLFFDAVRFLWTTETPGKLGKRS